MDFFGYKQPLTKWVQMDSVRGQSGRGGKPATHLLVELHVYLPVCLHVVPREIFANVKLVVDHKTVVQTVGAVLLDLRTLQTVFTQ